MYRFKTMMLANKVHTKTYIKYVSQMFSLEEEEESEQDTSIIIYFFHVVLD